MELAFTEFVWDHVFSLCMFPMPLPEQQIGGMEWQVSPATALQFHKDCFGNTVGTGRYDIAHDYFACRMQGVAWLDLQKKTSQPCLPLYRYPSKACTMTEAMHRFLADTLPVPAHTEPSALLRANALMERLYQQFRYQPGATGIATTASQAFALGCGVCQDYAHILIALCRAGGIAARYAAGMIFGEGATHAWVEVYDNGMWHGLDPTHNKAVDDGYLKLAHGRDAYDCRLNRGVFCGTAVQQQHVSVTLEELV